jgi:hypothetical protein
LLTIEVAQYVSLFRAVPPQFVPQASKGWSTKLPFSTEEYPFSLNVKARPVSTWGLYPGTNITDNLPLSPVDCAAGECGTERELRLTPYGGTNIRVAVLPWYKSAGQSN